MDINTHTDRPYRSHLQPACIPCRRRKSRCQTEPNSSACLMCKLHKSNCYFPDSQLSNSAQRSSIRRSSNRNPSEATTGEPRGAVIDSRPSRRRTTRSNTAGSSQKQAFNDLIQTSQEPLGLGPADDEDLNFHIVGPATTDDSRVLTAYLAGVPGASSMSTRIFLPGALGRSKPVLFTTIQKRPLGLAAHQSPSAQKLEMIEKLLEPDLDEIIDRYFRDINICMPILDENSFRRQLQDCQGKISPSLLACLYAHMTVYCRQSAKPTDRTWPDGRFIWNLANEALYSEIHLSPGVSIIAAIVLNVGGRPTTSLIGNGVLLSSAVSIAHSLGLNYNPLSWSIPDSEKRLRIRIWWALFIHDKWTSLAHGTPPRIVQLQQDVPPLTVQNSFQRGPDNEQVQAASIFAALAGLTHVLDVALQHIYSKGEDKSQNTAQIGLALRFWVDSLIGINRQIIVRGTKLNLPGASNLRLAYLSVQLLIQRIKLEAAKQDSDASEENVFDCYIQGRKVAEELLRFTAQLKSLQLNGFWLSVGAFAYPATVSFLLRHALETESSPAGLAQTASFQLAKQLIDTLISHKEKYDWDMGDACLAQHADIINKVLANETPEHHTASDIFNFEEFIMPDTSMLDQIFPSLWDPL